MTLISHWIHSKLEYVFGTASGTLAFVLDVPDLLLKALLAVVFGFLGALGAGVWKYLEKKLKKK